jgi:hypothetical protein
MKEKIIPYFLPMKKNLSLKIYNGKKKSSKIFNKKKFLQIKKIIKNFLYCKFS